MPRLAALVALLLAAPAFAQNDVADSPWFPAAEGTTWHYRAAGKKVVVKVTKHEKQAGVMCARFETLDKDSVIAVQHVAIDGKEVRRMAHNGEKLEPPLVLFKLPPARGQSWDVDSKMTNRSGTDTIAGKFTTDEDDGKSSWLPGPSRKLLRVTAELTIDGQKTTVVSWYEEKVGLVRQRITAGGNSFELELEKIDLPK